MKEYIITIIGATLLSAMAGIIAPEKVAQLCTGYNRFGYNKLYHFSCDGYCKK